MPEDNFEEAFDAIRQYIDDIVDQIEERLIALEVAKADRIASLEARHALLEGVASVKSTAKPIVRVSAKGIRNDI